LEIIESGNLLGFLLLDYYLVADSFRGNNLDNRHLGPESVETALEPPDRTLST
jgi:hypothetical protein